MVRDANWISGPILLSFSNCLTYESSVLGVGLGAVPLIFEPKFGIEVPESCGLSQTMAQIKTATSDTRHRHLLALVRGSMLKAREE